MTANASFVYAARPEAVRIPNAALRFKPDQATVVAMTGGASGPAEARSGDGELPADQRAVWVVQGGFASPHVVRVGITDGMSTELVEGDIRVGDAVVSEAIVVAGATKKGP